MLLSFAIPQPGLVLQLLLLLVLRILLIDAVMTLCGIRSMHATFVLKMITITIIPPVWAVFIPRPTIGSIPLADVGEAFPPSLLTKLNLAHPARYCVQMDNTCLLRLRTVALVLVVTIALEVV